MDGYYKRGDNYFCCPVCGFKKRVSQGRYRWDKVFVCTDCWEPRHPQETIRPRSDKIKADISVPEPTDVFIEVTDVTVNDL